MQYLFNFAAFQSSFGALAAPSDLEVNVSGGKIRGLQVEDGIRAFLGVPFAKPPIGDSDF